MLQPNDLVNGYQLQEMLDSSTSGETWRAVKQTAPDAPVILQLSRLPHTSADELAVLQSKSAELLQVAASPNILPYLETGICSLAGQDCLMLARSQTTEAKFIKS